MSNIRSKEIIHFYKFSDKMNFKWPIDFFSFEYTGQDSPTDKVFESQVRGSGFNPQYQEPAPTESWAPPRGLLRKSVGTTEGFPSFCPSMSRTDCTVPCALTWLACRWWPRRWSHLVVVDVLQGVADHADAHVYQVRRRHLEHLLRELLPVLVDLLQEEQERARTK